MGRNFNPLKGLWFPTLLIIFFLYGEPYDFSNEQTPSTFIDSEKENGTSTSAESQLLETVETTKSDHPSHHTHVTLVRQAVAQELMTFASILLISYISVKALIYFLSRKPSTETKTPKQKPITPSDIPHVPRYEELKETIRNLAESTLILYKFKHARGVKGYYDMIDLVHVLTETKVKPEDAEEKAEISNVEHSNKVLKRVATRHMKEIVRFVTRELILVFNLAKDSIAAECGGIAEDLKKIQYGKPFHFDYSKYTNVMNGFKTQVFVPYELSKHVTMAYFDILPRLIIINNLIGGDKTIEMHEYSLKTLQTVMETFKPEKPKDKKK